MTTQARAVKAIIEASGGTSQFVGGVEFHGWMMILSPSCSMIALHSAIRSIVSLACLLLTEFVLL